ncbi:EpsG family protein [Halomonas sp. C05BenzN]|uniref:EpsG family protein n=1 Tax=Halomonas sp. C05BenzN TaxID=3411041 RepID=UPI003B949205
MLLSRDDWRIERAPVRQETPILPPSRLFLIAAILLISIVVSSFVANRPLHVGTDTYSYVNVFNSLNYGHLTRISEPLFVGIALAVGSLTENYKFFLFVCAMILLLFSLYANHRLIDRVVMDPYRGRYITYLAFGLLLYSPFYFNMHVNILRHGMAVPFLLLGYIMVMEKRYLAATALLFASLGFHQSSLINVLLAPLLVFNVRFLVLLFLALSAIYLTSLSGIVLGPVFSILNLTPSFESISEYGASTSYYRSGVRFDFWLFTTFFVGMSLVAAWWNVVTEALPRILIVSSIPFLLFGYISYSDRLLVFTWFMVSAVAACCAAKILMNCDRTFLFVVAVLFNVATMGIFIGKLF